MILVDKRLKYLFDTTRRKFLLSENNIRAAKLDKIQYLMHKRNLLPESFYNIKEGEPQTFVHIPESVIRDAERKGNWDVIHLDGDYKNCQISNLEPVYFTEDPLDEAYKEIDLLKQQLVAKNEEIKKLTSECHIKEHKIINMTNQVAYEQKINKELNKELRTQDKEIHRLFDIIQKKR